MPANKAGLKAGILVVQLTPSLKAGVTEWNYQKTEIINLKKQTYKNNNSHPSL
jgi:hypothetical protein